MFAVENVDPAVGNVEVKHISRQMNKKLETPIELVPCKELGPGGLYEQELIGDVAERIEIILARANKKFLCPVNLESLPVLGNFGSEQFEYVEVSLSGC